MEQPAVALYIFIAAVAVLIFVAGPILLVVRSTSAYKNSREKANASAKHTGEAKAAFVGAGFEVETNLAGLLAVKGVHAGVTFKYEIVPGGRSSPPTAVVTVTTALPGNFTVTRELAADTFFRKIGYASEAQTGDAAFDDEFLLDGASRDYVQAVFADAHNREVVRALFAMGFDTVECGGGEASASKSVEPYVLDLPLLAGAVGQLAGLRAAPGTTAMKYWGITDQQIRVACSAPILVAGALFLWVFMGTQPLVEGRWGAAQHYWHMAALASATFIVAAAVALQGRAKAHRELALVIFATLPALVCAGWFAAILVNQRYDASAPRMHEARVLRQFLTTSKSSTYYNLEIESWRPDLNFVHVEVPVAVYKKAKAGQTVAVRTRDGRLGIEWVESVAAVASGP